MKPCLEYLELMNAVLDGEATPVQHEALSAHLAQCPACAALYEDLKALRSGSDALIVKAPESLKAGVMSRIAAEAKPANVVPFSAKTRKKTVSRWRSWAAMAAVFALVIGVGTTRDLFGGTSSAPMPAPSAAPAAAEPAEKAQDIGDISRISDNQTSDQKHYSFEHYSSNTTEGALLEDVASPAEAAPSVGPAEPSATPENTPISVALDMVVYQVYGESGYTWESTYSEDGSICHMRLRDGDTVVDEGTITYTGLSENGKFYCFSWSWAGQSEEDARLFRYAVPTDFSYVMWAGDTADMENYDNTLKN